VPLSFNRWGVVSVLVDATILWGNCLSFWAKVNLSGLYDIRRRRIKEERAVKYPAWRDILATLNPWDYYGGII
jgi:hypothetical protein